METGEQGLKIGNKAVKAKKITIAQWKELFDSIQAVPQMIVTVLTALPSERAGFFVGAIQESLDDITRITAVLTGLDEDYIHKNAALDELFAFYSAIVKVNNFGECLKNGQSVLGMMMPNLTMNMGTQDAG